ncbi:MULTISPECIES: MFS transporter [unclassified Lactobacillus]|uniref:MDR family MFS transporter n=1 Tax=unclassified Lactobacillus TaxID=2620435 RepID=UPI000EFAB341|nr:MULTISPECIES: MFS transporter [unclassified Lactobacillus]RMC23551.1 MFS transporter [Lactobacillus sp. ESL0247]RMC27350.1 MFS transporter [Lactobacillus sp. ESL0246]RMC30476.1 MFS transporter [Lactobacillus sp. ESL0245]RMC47288.1 MFS transporter [Lactobacillus sp. ESL0228]
MKLAHGLNNNEIEVKLRWLLLGELVTWIGSSFVWPLTSVYLNKQLHISLSVIGIVLFCNCASNVLGSLVAGWLYDRCNPYPLIVTGLGVDALILILMAFFHGWPEYWFWLVLTGFASGWNGTLINSIATSLRKYPGRYVFNLIYFAQNVGTVTGTLLVGYLYDFSIEFLFLLAAALFAIGFINAAIHYRPISNFHKQRHAKKTQLGKKPKAEPMPKYNLMLMVGFLISLAVTWLMYMNWESNLSVYMVSLGIPFHLYSLLWTLNGAIIVIVQVILARYPNIFKSLFQQIVFGTLMFAISFATLIVARDFLHFALSMVILTLGESTAFPAVPAYINDLSPNTSKGKYQGVINVARGIGQAFGPLFGGMIIDRAGYIPFFMVAAGGIFLMVILLLPLYAKLRHRIKLYK